jgi:hypothetical protein
MKFPQGSHIHKAEEFSDNASLLEEHLKKVDWKYLYKAFLFGWGTFLFCILTLILTIRLALVIS